MRGDAVHAPPGRIVVGVAGTAASVAALTWAAHEAALRGAVLHAVHAWQPAGRGRAPYAPPPRAQDREADQRAAEGLLHAAVEKALGADALAPGRPASPLLEAVEGLPVQVLLRCAAGAELLVLGGTAAAEAELAHQPVDHIGPVARTCLRTAPCPVVVVTQQQVRGTVAAGGRALATAAAG